MASYNRVILMGNLTRDPELRFLPSQQAVVNFGLAMNRKYKLQSGEDREEVVFIDCSAFGRQAEVINQYCQKGRPLLVEGRLKLDTWEDKQGGGKRSKLSVVVENFQLLGGRDGGGGHSSEEGGYAGEAPQRPQQRSGGSRGAGGPRPQPEPPYGQEQQFAEDDIPF
jgi:single-strand DNA-binding protein